LDASHREDPFAAEIRCTADPAKADKWTRSKWSRALRYAAAYKPDSEPLDQFVSGMEGSTPAVLASLGALGEVRGCKDGRRENKRLVPYIGLGKSDVIELLRMLTFLTSLMGCFRSEKSDVI
jgi:hypothetical protein